MAGLGTTVARLIRQQNNWQKGFSEGFPAPSLPSVRGDGLLEEVADESPNPGDLRHLRYVPRRRQPNAPLVVVLHGCTQTAAAYADGAGWIELADRYGFCLLLPEQRRSNNPNLCFNWFLPGDTTRGDGEVRSIHDMIVRTSQDCDIDPARVFITGLSAGGAMTSAMLATYPEIFAGGAIIAGLPYQSAVDVPSAFKAMGEARTLSASQWAGLVREASTHRGPWPKLSIWHGSGDQTVDPDNAGEIAKQWTALHGLPHAADRTEEQPTHIRRIWNDSSGRATIEEYTIEGLGHGTPVASGNGVEHFGAPAPFLIEAGLSSSYRIAQFWEIAQEDVANAQRKSNVTSALPSPSQNPRNESATRNDPFALAKPRGDIGAVINRALRIAGLIK